MKYIKENFNYLLFSFFLISIFFWFVEIGYSLIIRHKLVFPGAWYGPYCPIYGFTFFIIYLVFRKEDHILINIIRIAITVTVMEYIISFISDTFYHHIIWDYSNKFMNLNGRVCLEMSTIFTITGILSMYTIVPVTKYLYQKLEKNVTYINIILSIFMAIDMIITLT